MLILVEFRGSGQGHSQQKIQGRPGPDLDNERPHFHSPLVIDH